MDFYDSHNETSFMEHNYFDYLNTFDEAILINSRLRIDRYVGYMATVNFTTNLS